MFVSSFTDASMNCTFDKPPTTSTPGTEEGVNKVVFGIEAYSSSSTKLVTIRFTKITAAQKEDALDYHRARGLYFLAAIFDEAIIKYLLKVKQKIFYF